MHKKREDQWEDVAWQQQHVSANGESGTDKHVIALHIYYDPLERQNKSDTVAVPGSKSSSSLFFLWKFDPLIRIMTTEAELVALNKIAFHAQENCIVKYQSNIYISMYLYLVV